MLLNPKDPNTLAYDVLTYVEQRETEQIIFDVYDVTRTGAEVIAGFKPIRGKPFPDRDTIVAAALEALATDLRIIRFAYSPQITDWLFRSCITEIVRLCAWFCLSSARYDYQKPCHIISSLKHLTGDIAFHGVACRIPRHYQEPEQYLSLLSSQLSDQSRIAAILHGIVTELKHLYLHASGPLRESVQRFCRTILRTYVFVSVRGDETLLGVGQNFG